MEDQTTIIINSILRLGILGFVAYAAVRYKDLLALSIVFLFGLSIFLSRFVMAPIYITLPVATLLTGMFGYFVLRSSRDRYLWYNSGKGSKQKLGGK